MMQWRSVAFSKGSFYFWAYEKGVFFLCHSRCLSEYLFFMCVLFRIVSAFDEWCRKEVNKKISNSMLNQAFSDCLLNDSVHHQAVNQQTNHHHIEHIIITNNKMWRWHIDYKGEHNRIECCCCYFFCLKVTKNC